MTDAQNEPFERRVGTTIRGKWTLERLLGVGGMAAVYVAKHRIGRLEAIKILHAEVARNKDLRARFEQEAHAVNRFKHPGAVEIRDIDVTEDGAPFLVMELLEGEPLSERARRMDGIPLDEMLRLIDELLDVLAAAHAQGIVHRDIKLDNLFVQKDGRLKVLDFGIARMKDGAAKTMATRTGATLGTVAYMAPEQVKGAGLDHRADLFAVGATMFRLAAKRRIHEARNDSELLVKMATEPAPALASVAPHVPEGVCKLVDRALAFQRDRRYPDAATMQADVRAVRCGEPPPYATARLADGDRPDAMPPAAEPAAHAGPNAANAAAGGPPSAAAPVSGVAVASAVASRFVSEPTLSAPVDEAGAGGGPPASVLVHPSRVEGMSPAAPISITRSPLAQRTSKLDAVPMPEPPIAERTSAAAPGSIAQRASSSGANAAAPRPMPTPSGTLPSADAVAPRSTGVAAVAAPSAIAHRPAPPAGAARPAPTVIDSAPASAAAAAAPIAGATPIAAAPPRRKSAPIAAIAIAFVCLGSLLTAVGWWLLHRGTSEAAASDAAASASASADGPSASAPASSAASSSPAHAAAAPVHPGATGAGVPGTPSPASTDSGHTPGAPAQGAPATASKTTTGTTPAGPAVAAAPGVAPHPAAASQPGAPSTAAPPAPTPTPTPTPAPGPPGKAKGKRH